jgi:hypothetical protein
MEGRSEYKSDHGYYIVSDGIYYWLLLKKGFMPLHITGNARK